MNRSDEKLVKREKRSEKMFKLKREQKHKKIRRKVVGTSERPRMSVFRSSQHIYVQLIDDTKGVTIVSGSDLNVKTGKKGEKAEIVGEALAKEALKKNIKKIVFDRGGFRFHGRVAAVASGARKGGLEF